MLIEGGYLHSLKALLDKAKKTPEPTPPAATESPAPTPSSPRKSSSVSHGTVSAATVRNLTKQ